ncbi:MAG: ECF transporter S component [Thermoproteota archaeon]
MDKVKALSLTAILGALANVLAFPPVAIPIAIGSFESSIHFSQIPIFLCGVLAGPVYGLIVGALGGFFMAAFRPGIPFIFGGLALLGLTNGFLVKKLRPAFSGILAWGIQSPYVVITDYVWFTLFIERTPGVTGGILTTIIIKLTIEAVISAVLTDIIVHSISEAGLFQVENMST